MNIIKVIVLLISLALIGCASNPSQPTSDGYADIESLKKIGNYEGLVDAYKRELVQAPNDINVMQSLALAYFELGDVESARFYADYLMNQGVVNKDLLQLRGEIYHHDGLDNLAVDSFRKSVEIGNESSDVQMMMGISYCMLGRYPHAENAFNRARMKGYDDIAVKNNLAMVKFAENKYSDVVKILSPVYNRNPANKKVRANLAIAFIKLGDMQSAEKLLGEDYSQRELQQIARVISPLNLE
ncbi:tetratricopeptide repeat protein [Vibrio cyclitrophicus]|nr:tetratricopeptide repeat protein [Vibrio cyclitrophicus]UPR51586.1 tetratricopeptide repeat protein [Vibrio cyclitrophicus]